MLTLGETVNLRHGTARSKYARESILSVRAVKALSPGVEQQLQESDDVHSSVPGIFKDSELSH